MMFMYFNRWNSVFWNFGVLLLSCAALIACDMNHASSKEHMQTVPSKIDTAEQTAKVDMKSAKSLGDVAGQVALPEMSHDASTPVTASTQKYAGRYHTRISCKDAFADCESGEAEYILTLLPDGSAYWNVIHFGQVGVSDGAKIAALDQRCPTFEWQVNAAERELNVRCILSDINFYYRVDQHQNLVVNIDKLKSSDAGKTRRFLERYYFVPEHEYVLVKE